MAGEENSSCLNTGCFRMLSRTAYRSSMLSMLVWFSAPEHALNGMDVAIPPARERDKNCRDRIGYEAQAAMELEALASTVAMADTVYPVERSWKNDLLNLSWGPTWLALLNDLRQGIHRSEVAARFHTGLIRAVADTALQLCRTKQISTVVLAGGVFQNALLLQGVMGTLAQHSIKVLTPRQFPLGDGAISFGQAVVAIAQERKSTQLA